MIGPKYAGNGKNRHYGDRDRGEYTRYFGKMAPYNRLPDGPKIRAFYGVFREGKWAIRGRIGRVLGGGEGVIRSRILGLKRGILTPSTSANKGELHASVCHAPVPDIVHDHFAGFVQHLVIDPVLSHPDPVQQFCAGQFDRIVRERICSKDFLRAQKYSGAGLWSFPAPFFHAVFKRERGGTISGSRSHHTLF